MVGFPGETRARYRELLEFVREAEFDHLGVFAYSREAGTRAVRLTAGVRPATAERRREEILLQQQQVAFRKLDERVGLDETVMIELPAGSGRVWQARSCREAPEVDGVVQLRCAAGGPALRPGRFVRARIESRAGYDLVASAAARRKARPK
jgi:ribosomal protein S12 methylthiotransferase